VRVRGRVRRRVRRRVRGKYGGREVDCLPSRNLQQAM
jgi:hypothetical protein